MKKRIVLLTVAVILLVVIAAGLFIPATTEETIRIKAPFQNIASAVLNLEKWKQWHPAFENTDTIRIAYHADDQHPALVLDKKTITVIDESPFGIRVEESGGPGEQHYSLNVVPQTDGTYFVVLLKKKVNALQSLYLSRFKKSHQDPVLLALQQYLETSERIYGFHIELGPVVDTIVVTRQQIIAEKNLYTGVADMFDDLHAYIDREKLIITGHPMLYTSKRGKDSVMIMTGIPVDSVKNNEGSITIQTMPKGKMLIGHFEGKYSSIEKLMDAMRQYISDYSLQPAALPYKKFVDGAIPSSPEATVKCDVYYPVF